MAETIETVLLLALPASGKSEVRRYLAHLSPEACRDEFHLGPTTQLDDFPYVHLMRRVDDELEKGGEPRIFFHSSARPFKDPLDWGTLIQLVNEDYRDLVARRTAKPASAAELLFYRLDAAGQKAGIEPRLKSLKPAAREKLASALEREAAEHLSEKQANYPKSLEGRTLVIEFARGGPEGASFPLPTGFGYHYSLAQLDPEILKKASILYVWVTPEESRRKNLARTDPNDPGSILHHGVPEEVMRNDYGADDMDWLEGRSKAKGTLPVKAGGASFQVPVARFDNRTDKTSFLRADPAKWPAKEVQAIHQGLKSAFDDLWKRRSPGAKRPAAA